MAHIAQPAGKLRPVLEGDWRLIAPAPDLTRHFGPGNAPYEKQADRHELNAVVDHHVFQDAAGIWHAWACVRNTQVGRVLYHWRTADFHASPWEDTGEMVRCDRSCGESVDDYGGMEWLQSPFVVRDGGTFYMFYGGHTTGADASGRPASGDDPRNECQMCLMTSPDGVAWKRHHNADGTSRVFVGPGEVRDPCVVRIGGLWHCYYAGYELQQADRPGFYCRSSSDLVHWSAPACVHRDLEVGAEFGMRRRWHTECPFVVEREGWYYLFRTLRYYNPITYVYRSADPLDFGIDGAGDRLITQLPVAAPEVIAGPDGREYLTSVHNPPLGMQMAPLRWVIEA